MIEDRIKRIIKPAILESNAYHVANAEGLIKLDAMENPYRWPEELTDRWLTYLKQAELNRYPDASVTGLGDKLKQYLDLPDGIDILFGNGSDELIQIILMSLNKDADVIMAPEPTFVMYRLLSTMLELKFVGVPLNEDFSIDLERMLQSIEDNNPAVIFIAWPNNPTANTFPRESLEKIIDTTAGLVVIDEAYHVFAQKTMLSSIDKYPNVVLMRTFSKLGLAGLRLGTLFGAPEWINEFNKLRLPYNIGTLNQLSAGFVIDNINLLEEQAETIRQDRERLLKELLEIINISAWPSDTNFILFRVNEKNAGHVHNELIKQNILIKNLHGTHPLLENCLRVTVGTREENKIFLDSINQIMLSKD